MWDFRAICKWYHSNGRQLRGTKEPLDEGEREWKGWLKNQHSKNEDHGIHHFMANREKVETVTDFIFLGNKITADRTMAMKFKDACTLEGKIWQP